MARKKKAAKQSEAPTPAASQEATCCAGGSEGQATSCASGAASTEATKSGDQKVSSMEARGSCCGSTVEEATKPSSCKPKEDTTSCCGSKVEEQTTSCCDSKVIEKTTSCCEPTEKTSTSCCDSTKKEEASSCCGSKVNEERASCCGPKGEEETASCSKPKPIQEASCCSSASACCAPKQVAVAPASEIKSCYSSKKSACAATKAACPSTKAAPSGDVETVRLSIGGMTCTGCCTRIEGFLAAQPGVVGVNVSLLTSRGVVDYDPKILSPTEVETLVTTLGFTATPMPSESLTRIVLSVEGENLLQIQQALVSVQGVTGVREYVDKIRKNVAQTSVLVEYDPDELGARTLVQKLSGSLGGAHVLVCSPRPQAIVNEEEEAAKFARCLVWSCILTTPIAFVQYVVPVLSASVQHAFASEVIQGLTWQDIVGLVCSTPILLVIAYPIHESAYLALRFGSRVTMDVLISLSSISAYAFSVVTLAIAVFGATAVSKANEETFFEVTALLVTLILLGRYIEKIVKARASHSVDALLKIQAKTAILLDGRRETSIDVLLVERGDLLKVLPGARVPTDGVVVEGESSVDESMVTGESRRVPKHVGSVVIGGTINAQGVLIVRVTHTINESMLARIVHLVDEAQSSKTAIQSTADVVSSYFTTFIITVATAMFVAWYILASRHAIDTRGLNPLPFALRFAVTILVISCPCAISLAVPTAILVATSIGSHFGVLFKGGHALESLNAVDVVMFDKTGTLTTGQLQVVDVYFSTTINSDGHELAVLAAAERNSEHAIARALLQYAEKHSVHRLDAIAFEAIPGCGVRCSVDGHNVHVGSLKWLQEKLQVDVTSGLVARNLRFQREGCVVVGLAIDNDLRALVALRDAPREEARFVVEQLRERGIQPWIVSGDQRETALSVASQVGISNQHVISEALPHDKVENVKLLEAMGKRVAFIGDGVNDGPALAIAHVGIAVGAGTDVAIESADIVLVKDDLRDLLNALDLSRSTNRLIRWNFTWAFVYNLVMMPIACGAFYPFFGLAIPPALAGLSELLSSVPVILFSLLLNLWRPPFVFSTASENTFVAIDVDKIVNEATPLLSKH